MATLVPYALCTLNDVKESLGISSSDTSSDNLIIRKINAATDMIENFTGRRFKLTMYTSVEYDATNTNQIVLKQRPITDLAAFGIRDSNQNEDDWETIDSELYFVDSAAGVLDLNFRATGHWNRYRVTYTAGYSVIPADLAEACATLAAFMTQNPTGNIAQVRSKEEGQRRIEYFDANVGSSGSTNNTLFRQLGLLGTLTAHANNPINADK